MSNLEDSIFDDYDFPGLSKLLREKQDILDSGYPEPHYDETDDCPCPDHVAMRWYRKQDMI